MQGTTGSSPAIDRGKGFAEAISSYPNMNIVASQSGDFARDKEDKSLKHFINHPEADLVYSHNDEMTMGAIAALEAAGKVPGKDVMLASIDGTADAAKAVMAGKVIVCVECSPKFGPKAFELIKKLANGEKIPTNVGNIIGLH